MINSLSRALTCSILLPIIQPAFAQELDSLRLEKTVLPTFQRIELKADPAAKSYSGSVKIAIEVRQPVQFFRLHAEDLGINNVTLSGNQGPRQVSYEMKEFGIIRILPGTLLKPGSYSLTVDFSNDFHTDATSFYKFEADSANYASTTFWPKFARQAFPCWDEPDFKFPYQLVLTVPQNLLAISNTPVASETPQENQKIVTFAQTPPLPSYLIAFAIGPFDTLSIEGNETNGRVLVTHGQAHLGATAANVTPPILKALETYFGTPYPFKKLDLIALPEHLFGGMENPGAITFRDNSLLRDPETTTIDQKRRLVGIIAHELAHMWFGDLVTIAWWEDLWLSESFASWMAAKVTDEVFPQYQMDAVSVQSTQRAMTLDAAPTVRAVSNPFTAGENPMQLLTTITYQKGQAVLEMIEGWLGAETFRNGILKYIRTYSWRNAASGDLWQSLSEAAGKDIKKSMSTFVEQPGVPLVSARLVNDHRVRIEQRRFASFGEEPVPASLWQIPLILRYPDGTEIETQRVLFSGRSQTFDLKSTDRPHWLHINAGERGYYRWMVGEEMLATMAAHSESILSPRERIAFIDNLFALLDAGALGADAFLEMTADFADDPDPDVIIEVLDALARFENDFISHELVKPFSRYFRSTLRPALDRIGLHPTEGEDERIAFLRPRLIEAIGSTGRDDDAIRHSRDLAKRYLNDPKTVHPATAEMALRLAARYGDSRLFKQYKQALENAQSRDRRQKLVSGLASFTDANMVKEILGHAASGTLSPTEFSSVLANIATPLPSREPVFEWIVANYDSLQIRMQSGELARMVISLADGCSEELLARAKWFLSEQPKPSATSRR
ncbi:M1 family metallopeptidase [bacterium]|nr:M1 family metallopeptidase [bacterium]